MTSFPAANLITTAIFVLCLVTMALGAALAVVSARLIRSVCGLAICCIGLAGLYYFLHSPFLALMEILIYVGAVCVTIVFAVMLAEPEEPARTEKSGATLAWSGLATVIVCAFFCALVWLGVHAPWATPAALVNDGSIAAIGRALLTTYSMAFELISLALLVAILGALAIARTGRTGAAPIQADEAAAWDSSVEPITGPSSSGVLIPDDVPPKRGAPNRSAELVS
jgi:NADH:ubiquinone oxidoreductase subunit 6 (subunit J)